MRSVITLFFSLIGHLYHQCDSFIILKSSCTCSYCSFSPAFVSGPIEWLREQPAGLGGHHEISGSELLGPGCHCFRYLHCCNAAEPKWGILPLCLPLPCASSLTIHCSDFLAAFPSPSPSPSLTAIAQPDSRTHTSTVLDSPAREKGKNRGKGEGFLHTQAGVESPPLSVISLY